MWTELTLTLLAPKTIAMLMSAIVLLFNRHYINRRFAFFVIGVLIGVGITTIPPLFVLVLPHIEGISIFTVMYLIDALLCLAGNLILANFFKNYVNPKK